MCFSPMASFIAGAGLSGIGGVTMTNAKTRSELPFASIPLFFGVQQLTEGVVWLSLARPAMLSAASFVFMFFSHVFWPTFIPLAIALMEPVLWRRVVLYCCTGVGVVVSVYFLFFLLIESVSTWVLNLRSLYDAPHFTVTSIFSPYTIATCASCLFSSYRWVNFFGVVTFLSAISVRMPPEVMNVTGVFAPFVQALAWQQISVYQIVSHFTEITFIVSDKDADGAYAAIKSVSGENVC